MIAMQLPGTSTPFIILAEPILRPYTDSADTAFREYLVAKARAELEETGHFEALLAFLMPTMDLPLDKVYASGVVLVNEFMRSDHTKEILAQLAHKALSTLDAFFCVFISEIWMAQMEDPGEYKGAGSLEHRPDRKEGLMVTWERRLPGGTIDRHCLVHEIQRDGGRVILGEGTDISGAQGRLTSFLPPSRDTARN